MEKNGSKLSQKLRVRLGGVDPPPPSPLLTFFFKSWETISPSTSKYIHDNSTTSSKKVQNKKFLKYFVNNSSGSSKYVENKGPVQCPRLITSGEKAQLMGLGFFLVIGLDVSNALLKYSCAESWPYDNNLIQRKVYVAKY